LSFLFLIVVYVVYGRSITAKSEEMQHANYQDDSEGKTGKEDDG
jgi:hypothetical protein